MYSTTMDEDTRNALKQLHAVCSEGIVDKLTKILASTDCDVILNRRVGRDKKTALHVAVEHGHVGCVKLLVKQANIAIDAEDARKWTSLQIAASGGNAEIVTILLASGADVEHRAENGNTACHSAAMQGHASVVTLLLQANASLLNATNSHQWTPLHLACVDGHVSTAETLLERGADTEALTRRPAL